jgi:MoaA/NifB/PqqE/SkfB family radical SAM enzyme
MIRKTLRNIFRGAPNKPFGAWQIELTTRCPLKCRMCVRTGAEGWQQGDMPIENFMKILPYLGQVETIVLEGWGESLLHPDLAEIIRRVKRAGPEVGFVTSGFGLTESRASELVAAGVDFIGLSLAGATPETHGHIRPPSRLPDVLAAVRWFEAIKARTGRDRPRLHFVYLMLKDNLSELPLLPSLAVEAGVPELVLIHIIQISNEAQETQRAFACRPGGNDNEGLLRETERIARRLGVRLRHPSPIATEVAVCSENPLRNLYISVEGEVSPCVFLHPPVPSPFPRIFCGREHRVEKVSFGNLFRDPFDTLWRGPGYEAFRDRFRSRKRWYDEACGSLAGGGVIGLHGQTPLPPPPDACATCHKMLGV